ncbi:hypothetical protein [Streptomyces sp. NBC_00648]|uniref:hypothetical protein n=1 Tax=Streptomyces sp. NBC_00648 TaxID=2975797 RepID=UPI003250583E
MVENWNSANHDLLYGKDGDLTGSAKESQEVSMLALRLLQSALPGHGEAGFRRHERGPLRVAKTANPARRCAILSRMGP